MKTYRYYVYVSGWVDYKHTGLREAYIGSKYQFTLVRSWAGFNERIGNIRSQRQVATLAIL